MSVAERHGAEALDRFDELVVKEALPVLKKVRERLREQKQPKNDWGEEGLDPPKVLSSQELERIANQLIAEGRMPSLEQYMQLRQKATARWRGSKLVFGVIRRTTVDSLVFIPVERAQQLATIWNAIATAKTWREFKQSIPEQDWRELLELERSTPDLDAKFNPGDLAAFSEGDWPDWPEQEMRWWLEPEAIAKHVTEHQSVINGPFLSIDPYRLAEVVEALESVGHTCYRDDALVRRACGTEWRQDERTEEPGPAPNGEGADREQIAVFSSIEEAGRYFEEAFARGDRRCRQFFIGDEVWEVVNAGIPQLRRVIDILVVSETSSTTVYYIRALSEAGRKWLQEHFPDEQIGLNRYLAIENHALPDLMARTKGDGLIIYQTVTPRATWEQRAAAEN